MRYQARSSFWAVPLALSLAAAGIAAPDAGPQATAKGTVFHDRNGNGLRDPGEPGLGGIRVSNQRTIVQTGRNGAWELPLEDPDNAIFYVIKPRGWMTAVNKLQLPRFYYIHRQKGSPEAKYPGSKPTGPLPSSIDFPLRPQVEQNKFEALFFGDTQPRDVREVDYIRRDVVEPIIGKTNALFGLTLGDIVFDDLTVFEPLNRAISLLGMPWYNVLGNHDINYDSPDDEHANETFIATYGPAYYSFDYGSVHFVVLDNVYWNIDQATKRGSYSASFGKKQLEWLKNDLDLVAKNQLLVLTMHIPLNECADRQELFRLIEDRPHTVSFAAHTHFQEHRFLGAETGWHGAKPHHHVVNVTTCGSWWQGAPDELGIPHTTMRDGAPNGYSVVTFDGPKFAIEFRAARRPESYQMEIHLPETLSIDSAAANAVTVNVFGGSQNSRAEMRINGGRWIAMVRTPIQDPVYAQMVESDKGLKAPFRPLPAPIPSPHIWQGSWPQGLEAGMTTVEVRTTDMFGHVYTATKGVVLLPTRLESVLVHGRTLWEAAQN